MKKHRVVKTFILISFLMVSFTGNADPQDSGYQKILLVSLAKSGSSALYTSILNALPSDAKAFFDQRSLMRAAFMQGVPVLANTKFYRSKWDIRDRHVKKFPKKILLVRDPRDTLVSALVFKSAYMGFTSDRELRAEFIEALKQKEFDPKSVSLKSLYELREQLNSRAERANILTAEMLNDIRSEYYEPAIEFAEKWPDAFIYTYEQYVDKDFDEINRFLGFEIKPADQMKRLSFLVRTKRYGNWKNWFTEEDVEYFRPILKPFMDYFGYEDDWTLNPNPRIESKHASEYFQKLLGPTP